MSSCLKKDHLTSPSAQFSLKVFYRVMLHVFGLVAPLLHDKGEDPKGDSVHGEGTDDGRANPAEEKTVTLLFQAQLHGESSMLGLFDCDPT